MYVVQPFTVHVAVVLTSDVIVAVASSTWFASFLHTLCAVQAEPSAAKLYVTSFQSWLIAAMFSRVLVWVAAHSATKSAVYSVLPFLPYLS